MQRRTVATPAGELAVAEAGTGGRPLLLLHGFTGAKEDFTDWLDDLAALGWHAVAADFRGHGQSCQPDDEAAYSFSALADDTVALADALGWARFCLLGHSMGGMVAQLVAVRYGDRLDGLVLMSTGHGPVDGVDPAQADLAVAIAREQGMGGLADVLAAVGSPLATEADRRVRAERPGYEAFGDAKLRACSAAMYAALVPEFLGGADRLAALAHLDVPTLVVVGEQDATFLAPSERLAATIPGADLVVLAGAGHSPQFEAPAAWWDALTAFLAGVGGGRRLSTAGEVA